MSKADELQKLNSLKEKGYLTEEEYNQQKTKLLNDIGKKNISPKLLEDFKHFMSAYYPNFSLISTTSTTLGYQRRIPAQTPGWGTAIFLFLLGILPGIIYYLIAKKDEQLQTVNATLTEGTLSITGWNCTKICNEFNSFNQK